MLACTVRGKQLEAANWAEQVRRHREKIREIGDALKAAGYCTLEQQARVLGLSRSTTWTIRKAIHKKSGLSASTLARILHSEQLPAAVRSRIVEYVEDKASGIYGETPLRRRRFKGRVAQFACPGTRGERSSRTAPALVAQAEP
jgi:hypothetical protein